VWTGTNLITATEELETRCARDCALSSDSNRAESARTLETAITLSPPSLHPGDVARHLATPRARIGSPSGAADSTRLEVLRRSEKLVADVWASGETVMLVRLSAHGIRDGRA
jgi:hypothetical protein